MRNAKKKKIGDMLVVRAVELGAKVKINIIKLVITGENHSL